MGYLSKFFELKSAKFKVETQVTALSSDGLSRRETGTNVRNVSA
ncbi:MAG: hypothetical protein ACJA0B_000014 [Alcanivorax borkumensis]|jgi:hypothetical protein